MLDYAFDEPISPSIAWKLNHDFRFMDNGLIELGYPLSTPALNDWFYSSGATHVAAPDRIGRWMFNFLHAKDMAKIVPLSRVFVTLAGPTPEEFERQYNIAYEYGFMCFALPYKLNRIGLSPKFRGRKQCRFHLFGFKKPEDYSVYPIGTTLDTVEPINAAILGWEYVQKGFASFPRSDDYMTFPWDPNFIDLACSNVKYFKEVILNGHQQIQGDAIHGVQSEVSLQLQSGSRSKETENSSPSGDSSS